MEYVVFSVMRVARKLHLSRLIWMGTSKKMFKEYFKGFEKVEAVRGIFGEKTEEVLNNLKVEFIWFGYMGVDNSDGHLMVNGRYLSSGNKTDIYLDVIHELCHVKQWMEGKELFDPDTIMLIDQLKWKLIIIQCRKQNVSGLVVNVFFSICKRNG